MFTPSDCKDKGNRKFEFVTKAQFLLHKTSGEGGGVILIMGKNLKNFIFTMQCQEIKKSEKGGEMPILLDLFG